MKLHKLSKLSALTLLFISLYAHANSIILESAKYFQDLMLASKRNNSIDFHPFSFAKLMAHTKNTESASFYFAFGKRSKIIDPLLKNFDTTLDRVIYLAETNIISKEDSRGSFLSIFINLDTPRAPGSKRFIDIIVQTPKKNFFPVFKEDSNALISLESLQRKTSLILIKSHEHASINPDIEFVSTTDPSVFGKIHAWTSLTFEVNSQSIQDDFIKFIANEYMLIFE